MSAAAEAASAQESELLAWAGEVAGGAVSYARRLVGGNRRRAWAVDVSTVDGRRLELFLRFASGGGEQGADPYTLRREAVVYRALAQSGVQIPRILASHPSHQAMLIERIAGETAYRAASPEDQGAIAADFIRAIHKLHSVDARSLDLPGLAPVTDITSQLRRELEIWTAMYAETGRLDPLIELALAWLRAEVPELDAPAVLVHGDAGPGNFIFSGGRLAALIDWELSHLGDPLEDLAWLSWRCVLEPFPDFARSIREYEALAGRPVDRRRLLYHRVFVTLRVAVIRHRGEGEGAGDSDLANSLVSRLMNRRLLVEVLGQATATPRADFALPAAAPTQMAPYFDYALEQLRTVIGPRSTDPLVVAKTKGIARVLKYLQRWDALGPAYLAQELDDLAALLGAPPASIAAGRDTLAMMIRAGTMGRAAALSYLTRQSARDSALGAAALGALTKRSFPEI